MNTKNILQLNNIDHSGYDTIQTYSEMLNLNLPKNKQEFLDNSDEFLKDVRHQVIIYLGMVTYCSQIEDYHAAKQHLHQLEPISAQFDDLHPRVLSGLGWNYYRLNNVQLAESYYKQALECKGIEPQFKATTLCRYSILMTYLNQLDRALELCTESTKLIQLKDSKNNYKALHIELSNVHYELGNYKTSLNILNDIIHQYEEFGLHKSLFTARNNISNTLSAMGRYTEALAQLKIAQTLTINDRNVVIVHRNLGEVYYEMGEYETGLTHLQQALDTAKAETHSEHIVYIYEYMAKIYKCQHEETLFTDTIIKVKDAIYDHVNRVHFFSKNIQQVFNWLCEALKQLDRAEVTKSFYTSNKTWQEIKYEFMYNIMMYHVNRTGVNPQLFKNLGITRLNYYTLRGRLGKRGFKFPDTRLVKGDTSSPLNPKIQSFIGHCEEKYYNTSFAAFEKQVFLDAFKMYNFNRRQLAAGLKVSYPFVVKRVQQWFEEDKG